LRITVEPHTRLPVHFHPVVNVAYMLEGELTVVADDGQKKVIGEGQSLVELVGQYHYGINETDRPARLVVVYFGEKNEPITVKE
ncbi:MAG TPA: cupin domain-containing protein, partial [Desulfopila sp.]|nr:cupin domain-containing protein [Desulfopila sp.]